MSTTTRRSYPEAFKEEAVRSECSLCLYVGPIVGEREMED